MAATETTGKSAFDLSGQTALITGAAGLLGKEHAAALAEIGATVVLTDASPDALERAVADLRSSFGDRILGMPMDVTKQAHIESVRAALKDRGGVQVLVNNAAVDPKVTAAGGPELSRLENFPLETWDWQVAVGLTGAFLCARAFGTDMAASGHGVILNIASDLSVIAPDQRLYRKPGLPDDQQPVKPVTYSVIKTGLIGLTRYLAGYWAQDGVRVNALSPGGIYNEHPQDFVVSLANLIPMGRMARKGEYQAVVQFLCSPASSYMTGQNVVVDGGRTIL